ncbi:MAG: glyoxalase/bleomycin resistance/extradiol dioxygenase family protein [Actinomycetia bacterium]|nr:glyoxalase/bleomycin resistance/extradiol dioxygenase family protein [Actinomycetes bacterium]
MRLQLAMNVNDLDESIDFYSRMFGATPDKVKPGYANWALENPPLKFVLFEAPGEGGSINHLGVETETSTEVVEAEGRLSSTGLETTGVDDTICCYAEKTETWVQAPDDIRWEWYVKTGEADQLMNTVVGAHSGDGPVCCG